MIRYLCLSQVLKFSKSSIWVIGLVISPLFALPAVESRTGDPVIPVNSTPAQRYSNPTRSSNVASRSFEPTYSSSSAPLSAEDRAAHLTLTQIEALQREVSELRGLVETQEHQIKQLKKSQQDFYVDLESRIKQLKNAGNIAGSSSASVSAATANKASKPAGVVSSLTNPAVVGTVRAAGSTATPRSVTTPTVPMVIKDKDKDIKPTSDPVPASSSSSASNSTLNPSISVTPVQPLSSNIPAASTPPPGGEQEAYQAAYQLVRTKRYGEAISSLQQYLNRFPKAENAAAAHYWLGEVYLLQWQNDKINEALLEKAFHEFSTVTAEFPQHTKVVDATLKLGLIEFDKGNQATAEHYLTEVKTRYPGTAAARLAETRLQQISSD